MALTYDEDLLTDSQRRRLRENNDANFRHAMNSQAHERFVERRLGFVGNHGGAVSPFERNALSGEADRLGFGPRVVEQRRLMDHEMDMLKQKGEDEVRVAEKKRLGMREQGQGAAEANANASITNNKREWKTRERIERQKGQDAFELEKERQRGAQSQSEREWGRTGEDGTHTPGGRERIAEIEGKSRVDAAKAQAEAQAQAQAQKNALAEQKERARWDQRYKGLDAKTQRDIDTAANSIMKEKGISFADARAQVMAAREQSQQQDGNITTDSTGAKWEIVKDANGKPVGKRRVQ